ncbi:MAG: SusC/RagA family TonB-linked outer membrane protein, partial [Tannerella sp.]|nr:SusC/RagA family TonB-linked outer membrane protein [Tannerella sp.]
MIFLCLYTLFAKDVYSQQKELSLDLRNATIKDVISEIEKTSDYVFLVTDDASPELNKKTSIHVDKEVISNIMQTILEGTDLAYAVVERQVSVHKKLPPKITRDEQITGEKEIEQQKKKVTGSVTDKDGESIVGAGVVEKGTTNGITTDAEGMFSLQVGADAVLTVSYIGYISQEVNTAGKTTFDIVLQEGTLELEEVVIVAYGTQTKHTITGAVTSIGSKEIQKTPAANVANALTGRLSGVTFIQQSGQPGADDPIIRIRGISSLGDPLGSANDPLVLVDGVERNFSRIDPSEIENISVLKDAASTAVYGVRGANGVIIITTKRGLSGKPQLSYSGQFGLQQPSIHLKYADAYQYAYLVNEGQENDGIAQENRTFTLEEIEKYRTNSDPYLYPSMDWMDYLLKEASPQHKHNLNVQGGAEKLKYFVSLGILDQGGIFKDLQIGEYNPSFSYRRYNFRSNFDFELTRSTTIKINAGGNMGNRNGPSDNDGGNGNFWFDLQQANPLGVVGVVDGQRIFAEDRRGRPDPLNDLYFNGFRNVYNSDFNFDISVAQSLDAFLKGLKVHGTIAYDSYYTHTKDRDKSYPTYYTRADPDNPGDYLLIKKGQEWGMGYNEWYSKWRKVYAEFGINYEKSINNHNITALALYNQQKRWYPGLNQADIPTAYMGFVGRV